MKEFIENLVADAEIASAIDAEYQRRVRGIRAESALTQAVTAAGGRNLRAIRALIDENALAQAEDQAAAAREAVAAVRRDSPYLFGTGAVFASNTGQGALAQTPQDLGSLSFAEYRRFRKGC